MANRSFRKHSRLDYACADDNSASIEQINAGSLQRVADAVEKMAEPWSRMNQRIDRLEAHNKLLQAQVDALIRQRNALRGVVTRMKKAKGGGR